MARWLQSTVLGAIYAELLDPTIAALRPWIIAVPLPRKAVEHSLGLWMWRAFYGIGVISMRPLRG